MIRKCQLCNSSEHMVRAVDAMYPEYVSVRHMFCYRCRPSTHDYQMSFELMNDEDIAELNMLNNSYVNLRSKLHE